MESEHRTFQNVPGGTQRLREVTAPYPEGMSLPDRTGRIDHTSPVPLWFQVAAHIMADIDSGALAAGAKLATELELAAQYGVARNTIRRVMAHLAGEGLVTVQHGKGTYVTGG